MHVRFPAEGRAQSDAFIRSNWDRTLLLKCRPINDRRSNVHRVTLYKFSSTYSRQLPLPSHGLLIQTTAKAEILIYGLRRRSAGLNRRADVAKGALLCIN